MEKHTWWKTYKEYVFWIGGALILALLIRMFVAEKVVVDGESMLTNFESGQQLFIEKVTYRIKEPKRYDVIVLEAPKTEQRRHFIKRVIGLPGETVQVVNGKVMINGKQLTSDVYGREAVIEDPGIAEEPITLGTNEYFVLGDNRNESKDSRDIGTVNKSKIIGKVMIRVWPFDQIKTY